MPDITMCEGTGCHVKEMCYRHTAKPSKYAQSYFVTPPVKDGDCGYFMKMYPGDEQSGKSDTP